MLADSSTSEAITRKELEDVVGRVSAELKAEIEVVRTEVQTVCTELAKQHTRLTSPGAIKALDFLF